MLIKKTPLAGHPTRRLSIKIRTICRTTSISVSPCSLQHVRYPGIEIEFTRPEYEANTESRRVWKLDAFVERNSMMHRVFGNNGVCVEHEHETRARWCTLTRFGERRRAKINYSFPPLSMSNRFFLRDCVAARMKSIYRKSYRR